MSKPIEWTDAHRREALRRTYEIAADLVSQGREDDAESLAARACDSESQPAWEASLYVGDGPALPEEHIDREVRRVDALATGRLVRETVWRREEDPGRGDFYSTEELARGGVGLRAVRVTRIRRAR